jgi:hypothetical protein
VADFFYLWVSWVSFVVSVVVAAIIVIANVVVVLGVVLSVIGVFELSVVVSQYMRLPLLNASEEKIGWTPTTKLPILALPSFEPAASA